MKMSAKTSAMIVMTAVILMISVGAINAQENFSGKWAFNESKSNLGQAPAGGGQGQGQARGGFRMGATEMNITQQGNALNVARTRQGRDGQPTVTNEKYDLTGKVTENPAMNTTRKSTVTWSADKKVMTVASTSTFNMQGESREMKSTEIWKLTEGGKVLTIESINSTQMGEMKTTLVYDKK